MKSEDIIMENYSEGEWLIPNDMILLKNTYRQYDGAEHMTSTCAVKTRDNVISEAEMMIENQKKEIEVLKTRLEFALNELRMQRRINAMAKLKLK